MSEGQQIRPGTLKREVKLYFRYEWCFQRRRGWRMLPEIKATIPMDADAPFCARALNVSFIEGDPADIQHFLKRYTLEIASPAAWFQAMPIPALGCHAGDSWCQYLVPEVRVKNLNVIEVTFRGEPFGILKSRFVWALAINGCKLYYTPKETA